MAIEALYQIKYFFESRNRHLNSVITLFIQYAMIALYSFQE